jgi:hypothetical protein
MKKPCAIMENIPPKGVTCSDFICTLAMPDEDLFDFYFATLS